MPIIAHPVLYFIFNHRKGKWTSFKIGWMFGFGYFISNLYWITNALTFEENFKPLIPIALILIPLFLGGFYVYVGLSLKNIYHYFFYILLINC